MSTGPVTLRPGVDVVKTPLLNEGGFSASNLVRWFNGILQKLGGCSRLSSQTITGLVSALHPFTDLNGNNYIGIGTNTTLQLYAATASLAPGSTSNLNTANISVTPGSKVVTVTDTSYSPVVGQTVTFTNAIINGVDANPIQGNYTVATTNPGANTYTFMLPNAVPMGALLTTFLFGSSSGSPLYLTNAFAFVGGTITTAFPITLTGTGLTPLTVPAATYNITFNVPLSAYVINLTSSTNATMTIQTFYENGGLANIVYQPTTRYPAGSINNIPAAAVTSDLSPTAVVGTGGSNVVTITDASYSPVVGQTVTFANALIDYVNSSSYSTTILQGNYIVTSSNPAMNTYTINLPAAARSGVTFATFLFGSASGTEVYLSNAIAFSGSTITTAFAVTLTGTGLSPLTIPAATYNVSYNAGTGGYIINLTSSTNATMTIQTFKENGGNAHIIYQPIYSGIWSLDNWGQNLVGAPQGSYLYSWTPPLPNVSSIITNAPHFNNIVFVAMPQQQMISLGSDAGGYLDPLLVRFSDVGDYTSSTSWTALATNQAGSFRISSGSMIVGGLQGPQQGFIWTDVDLWNMQYIGFPLVYSFNRIGQGCGLIAKRAAAQLGGMLWWLGKKGAFYFDGQSVHPLPCPVWDYFFNNVDQSNLASVFAGTNSDFNEISWFFPVIGSSGVPTNYIKVCIQNPSAPVWDYGVLTRYAWCDRSAVGPPSAVDDNNLLQAHETSNDLDGVAMNSYATTAWFKLTQGQDFVTLKRIIWDAIISGSGTPTMEVTVNVANYPNAPISSYGPFTVTEATQYLTVSARGRICQIQFQSTGLGSFWRLGEPLFTVSASGRR